MNGNYQPQIHQEPGDDFISIGILSVWWGNRCDRDWGLEFRVSVYRVPGENIRDPQNMCGLGSRA